MNNGADAQTMYTVAFRYFRTQIKKTIKHIHNLKICKHILVLNKSYSTISEPCLTPELWNRQHSKVVIFEDTKHIVVGLFNSPTTIKRRQNQNLAG